MRKKLKKMILEDLNQKYQIKTTAEDIISKTDFFTNTHRTTMPFRKWKIATCALIVYLILFSGFVFYREMHYQSELEQYKNAQSEIITELEKEIMGRYVTFIPMQEDYSILLCDGVKLYLYRAEKKDNILEKEVIYFYKIGIEKKNLMPLITFRIGEEELNVTKDNLFGIFTCAIAGENEGLHFYTEINGVKKEYRL